MLTNAPFETELWLFALSAISGLHWLTLRGGLEDMIERMVRSCEIRAEA